MGARNRKLPPTTFVLVGMMGAGKTCIGRQMSECLGARFSDADDEIEAAAGCSVEDIFEIYGESAFRDVERRVIARLLQIPPPHIIATGGGAFMNSETRDRIKQNALSVWLRADLDLLLSRVTRRNDRPLLKKGDQRRTMEALMQKRDPIYGEADIVVDTGRESPDGTVEKVLDAVARHREAVSGSTADGG